MRSNGSRLAISIMSVLFIDQFVEPSMDRIGAVDDKMSAEQFEQEEEDDIKKLETMADGPEKQKFSDELNKKKDNDNLECQQYFKKAG